MVAKVLVAPEFLLGWLSLDLPPRSSLSGRRVILATLAHA